MNKLLDLWDYLDGKKTVIGAIIHFLVIVLGAAQSGFGFQILDEGTLNQIDHVATVVIAGGLVHKTVKAM